MLSTEMCKHISIRTLHLGSGLWLWLDSPIPSYLNILGYLGTTLAIERAASNGSFDPPEGWGWQKNVMNSYMGKDLTFVFLRHNICIWILQFFTQTHTCNSFSSTCIRWARRGRAELSVNFSEQSHMKLGHFPSAVQTRTLFLRISLDRSCTHTLPTS